MTPAGMRSVRALLATYWTADLSPDEAADVMGLWAAALEPFCDELVAEACVEYSRLPGARRPTPGDIYAICCEHRKAEQLGLPISARAVDPVDPAVIEERRRTFALREAGYIRGEMWRRQIPEAEAEALIRQRFDKNP